MPSLKCLVGWLVNSSPWILGIRPSMEMSLLGWRTRLLCCISKIYSMHLKIKQPTKSNDEFDCVLSGYRVPLCETVDSSCNLVHRCIPRDTSWVDGFLVPSRISVDFSCHLVCEKWIPRATSLDGGFLVPPRVKVDSSCHFVSKSPLDSVKATINRWTAWWFSGY